MPSTRSSHKSSKKLKAAASSPSPSPPDKKKVSTKKQKTILNKGQQYQILIDIEQNPGYHWKDLKKKSPVYYKIGEPYETAFRNRFNYLVTLKEEKPTEYWELYRIAPKKIEEHLASIAQDSTREKKDDSDAEEVEALAETDTA